MVGLYCCSGDKMVNLFNIMLKRPLAWQTRSLYPDLLYRGRIPRNSNVGHCGLAVQGPETLVVILAFWRRSSSRGGICIFFSTRLLTAAARRRHRRYGAHHDGCPRCCWIVQAAVADFAYAAVGAVFSRLSPMGCRHLQMTASSVVGAQIVQRYANGA